MQVSFMEAVCFRLFPRKEQPVHVLQPKDAEAKYEWIIVNRIQCVKVGTRCVELELSNDTG